LTQKSNKKSQERKDIQHLSFIRLDVAVVLLWLKPRNIIVHDAFCLGA